MYTWAHTPVTPLTCCWRCSLAPYRCRLAPSSTRRVKCTARHRKPFRPRLLRVTTSTCLRPLSSQTRPSSLSRAVQLFSRWSPILRRREASSWATEHAEGRRRALQLESPGRSRGWFIGSQHIFSDRDPSAPSSLFKSVSPPGLPPLSTVLFINRVTWYNGFTSSSPKERCNVESLLFGVFCFKADTRTGCSLLHACTFSMGVIVYRIFVYILIKLNIVCQHLCYKTGIKKKKMKKK